MAEVTEGMIHALAPDILARVERTDADMHDWLAEVRAMRAESGAFVVGRADRPTAVRQEH